MITPCLKRLLPTVFCGLASLTLACGQSTISLTSGSGAPGSSISLPITLAASQASAAAVEWTLSYPTQDVSSVVVAGTGTATAAGKSVDCVAAAGKVTCLISGLNSTVIANGVVATATLNIASSAPDSSAPIGLSTGSAADAAGQSITTTTTGAAVSIQVGTPKLSSFACSPTSLQGPGSSTCSVGLSSTASVSTVVSLGYTAPSGVVSSLQGSVTVAPGSQTATFAAGFNAVATASTVAITARLNGASLSASIQVVPASGSVGAISISPTSVTLTAGKQQQFTAKVTGSTNTAVRWSLSPAVGTLSRSGLYTAPASVTSAQSVSIIATSVANSSQTATAQVSLAVATGGTGTGTDVHVWVDQPSSASNIVSPLFSTSLGNELLLAFISADYRGGANTTVSSVVGAGLNWVRVINTNTQAGTSEIWRAFSAKPLNAVSVTANLSQNVVSSLTVLSFSGVDTTGTAGSGAIGATASGSGRSGAPSATLRTTRNNSRVIAVGNDFDNAISRVPLAGQGIVHQSLSTSGDTYWVQILAAPVPASGTSVTMGDSSPTTDRYNLSVCEIRAPLSGAASNVLSSSISPVNAAEVLK